MSEPLSMDQAFIKKLTDIVLANLANENFGVKELAIEAGISRVSLHRRLKSSKKQDASQFIRETRLQRAMEMLRRNEGTVAEIAFRVGFGSPTYFIKCFHEYYGFPPGEVRKMESIESLDDQVVEQIDKTGNYKGIKVKPDLKSVTKRPKHKNILIASFGILSGLLITFILYVLLKQPEKSIVVLPFKNLSDNPGNQYFADGITEDILNHLFRISEMRVISRTSAEYFRDNPMTSPEIGRKLHVNYVLEGSVQTHEQEVRIFVQLIDARDDQHMLSEEYEGKMTNIFAFQSDIAKKVANALKTVISSKEIRQ